MQAGAPDAGCDRPSSQSDRMDTASASGTGDPRPQHAALEENASRDGMKPSSPLIFARLRRDLPPPSRRRQFCMLIALMMTMVLLGWSDGSMGPLLPFLQNYYGINSAIMSLIWVTSFAGSVVAAALNIYLTDRIGFGLVAPLGALAQAICYALCSSGGPYPLFCFAFALSGFGFALQDAQVNNVTSRLPSASTKMFLVQASFGLGATIAPFISTAFVQGLPDRAYEYFLVALGIALVMVAVLLVVFGMRTEAQIVGSDKTVNLELTAPSMPPWPRSSQDEVIGTDPPPLTVEPEVEAKVRDTDGFELGADPRDETPSTKHGSGAKMMRILKTPVVYALLGYNFIYVGIEISIGGWLTSFLTNERGGTTAAGYATTGFFGGMTLGRIILIPITHKLGFRMSVYVFSLIALGLELIIWFTHSLVGNAVCFALIGMVFGPVYPAALLVISEHLDDDLRGGVLGLFGSTGASGAAAVPLITGAIADRFGFWTLQPLMVAMIAADLALWSLLPRKKAHARD